jgi:hypothetical protein
MRRRGEQVRFASNLTTKRRPRTPGTLSKYLNYKDLDDEHLFLCESSLRFSRLDVHSWARINGFDGNGAIDKPAVLNRAAGA